MRHAAAGASLEQLHPALDATQGGGTRETSGVASRGRLAGRAFVLEGRLARARPGRPSTGAGCYSSGAIPACYTQSLTYPAALGGVSGRMQLLKACSGHGMAHEYLFDPTGRSWSGGRPHSVFDLVKQVLVRHAAAGPCHGQLHPA